MTIDIIDLTDPEYADLNAVKPEAVCRIIEGTARSMGIDVVD